MGNPSCAKDGPCCCQLGEAGEQKCSSHEKWPHLEQASWPPEAGIVAVGLGQNDGVVCWKVTWVRDSGEPVLFGEAAAEMKRRLTWPDDAEGSLTQPGQWLAT